MYVGGSSHFAHLIAKFSSLPLLTSSPDVVHAKTNPPRTLANLRAALRRAKRSEAKLSEAKRSEAKRATHN